MRVGPDPHARRIRNLPVPGDARRIAIRPGQRDLLRRIDRSPSADETADRAGAAVLAMLAILVARLACGAGGVVADFSRAQRVRSGDRGCPARGDRRKDLHHQRDQDDRKESLVAPPHPWEPHSMEQGNHRREGESRSSLPQVGDINDRNRPISLIARRKYPALRGGFCPPGGRHDTLLYYLNVNSCMQAQFGVGNFQSFPKLHEV